MQTKYITKATDLAKDYIKKRVRKGDTVVDATVGNGNDTLFLSRLVSDSGRVYGFDVQSIAIKKTAEKLEANGLSNRVVLINDGHENIEKHIKSEVSAIMFNLGYLPGQEHNITTKHNTTLIAIESGIKLLEKNGLMTIAVYIGHEEGRKEKEAILNYLEKVDQSIVNVLKLEFINQRNAPPFLLVIEKR